MSQPAARWEPKELTEEDYSQAYEAAARATERAAAAAAAAGEVGLKPHTTGPLPQRAFADKGLDLEEALARRRAANS
jgi:hypothetical protein